MAHATLPVDSVTSRRRVIDLLVAEGELSRAELARRTGLTRPAISYVVGRLLAEGLVREAGVDRSSGGRRPVLLRLGGDAKLAAGIEVDAAACRCLLTTLDGGEVAAIEVPVADGDDAVFAAIEAALRAALGGRDRRALLGCGLAVPGVVDPRDDTVDAPRLGWRRLPVRRLLIERLGTPIMIADRGKAAGLGELWSLGEEKPQDLIYLYLGRGVAGALVLRRRIYQGPSHTAGEVGHMSLNPAGPRCDCGRRGCLEAYVSTRALIARARARVTGFVGSALAAPLAAGLPDEELITRIGAAAEAGDALARDLIAYAARWLAVAIANLINLLNPTVIVLGGPLAQWGDPLRAAIARQIDHWALPAPRRAVRLELGRARERAAALGAAALVLQRAGALLTTPAAGAQG